MLSPEALNVSSSIQDFTDPNTSTLLLELRAALIVRDHAKNLATNSQVDASVDQRVSKAVTEAFIAVQVADIIKGLEDKGIKGNDADVVKKMYLLVSQFYPCSFCHSLCGFVLDSDRFFFSFAVSFDDSRRCACRSPLVWIDPFESDIRRITTTFVRRVVILNRSYSCCAPCYSTFMSRIDTRIHWIDGCFWIHRLGFR